MDAYKEDTTQSFRTILFLILFLLFAFSSSGNPGSHTSSSAGFHSQNEYVSGNLSVFSNAIISCPVSVPELQKYCDGELRNTSNNPFTFLNKISDFNRRIALKIIQTQKSELAIEIFPLSRLYNYPPSNEDDNLPVLS